MLGFGLDSRSTQALARKSSQSSDSLSDGCTVSSLPYSRPLMKRQISPHLLHIKPALRRIARRIRAVLPATLTVIAIAYGCFLQVENAEAQVLYSQPFKTNIENVCTDIGGCGTFIGSKIHRTYATTTYDFSDVSTTSILYLTFSLGIEDAYISFVSGGEAFFVSGACTFTSSSTILNAQVLASLVTHNSDNPAIIETPLYSNGDSACNSILAGDGFYVEYKGGNWNGGIYSYVNSSNAPYMDLTTEPSEDFLFDFQDLYSQTTYNTRFLDVEVSTTTSGGGSGDAILAGWGTSAVDGTYTTIADVNSYPAWYDGSTYYICHMNTSHTWEIGTDGLCIDGSGDGPVYYSDDAVATPDLVTTWLANTGSNPAGTVTIDSGGDEALQFDVTYFVDSTEVDYNNPAFNPSYVQYRYSLRPSSEYESEYVVIGTTTGTSTIEIPVSGLADGTYDLVVNFSNNSCLLGFSVCPFPNAIAYKVFTISGGVLVSQEEAELPVGDIDSPSNLFEAIGAIFIGVLRDKHPFAWVYQSLYLVRTYTTTGVTATTTNTTIDMLPMLTVASSSSNKYSNGMYLAKISASSSSLHSVNLNPITSACSALASQAGTFNCTLVRYLIGLMLWVTLIIFDGVLLYRFLNPERE